MSRSGYVEDIDGRDLIRWRGAVASAIRGKRGQDFLRKLLTALDALPEKRLIADELEADGEVCAIGSVGRMQSIDMSTLDPEDYDGIAAAFGISQALVRELESVNDDWHHRATAEERFAFVRKWAVEQLAGTKPEVSG